MSIEFKSLHQDAKQDKNVKKNNPDFDVAEQQLLRISNIHTIIPTVDIEIFGKMMAFIFECPVKSSTCMLYTDI